jgi:hypothetical protein
MWITVRAELVAELLRPGNAGLNTAADHVVVLDPQPLLRWINRFQTVCGYDACGDAVIGSPER